MFLLSLLATEAFLTAKRCYLFLLKSFTIEFWLGSKYSSCWYCQKSSYSKDISPLSHHVHFTLLHRSAKCVTESNWTPEDRLLTGEHSFWLLLIKSLKMTCTISYAWFLFSAALRFAQSQQNKCDLPKVSKDQQLGSIWTCLKFAYS